MQMGTNFEPETRRMQSIIDKTASFLSKQSSQMEIVLKTKQSGNPQFGFLDFDHYLNAYYKFILGKIKDGSYVPNLTQGKEETAQSDTNKEVASQKEEEQVDQSKKETREVARESADADNESDGSGSESEGDEGELHPLLQAHRRPVSKPESASQTKKNNESKSEVPTPPPVERKPLGRPEDLTKLYMSMKYKSNPEPESIEEKKEKKPEVSTHEYDYKQPPPPPPPQASTQDYTFSNQMLDYGQRPSAPPINLFPQGLLPPPPPFQQQPPIGSNFRMHPQAFPPVLGAPIPPIGVPPPPMMPQGTSLLQQPMPPGVDGNIRLRPPINTPMMNHPLPPGLRPPQTFTLQGRQTSLSNQPRGFTTNQIGPQLPPRPNPQYSQRNVGPPPHRPPTPQGVDVSDEQQELLPPGVDETENSLPPPPPLPFAPNIADINTISKTKSNELKKADVGVHEDRGKKLVRDDDEVPDDPELHRDRREESRQYRDDAREYRDDRDPEDGSQNRVRGRDDGDESREYRNENREYLEDRAHQENRSERRSYQDDQSYRVESRSFQDTKQSNERYRDDDDRLMPDNDSGSREMTPEYEHSRDYQGEDRYYEDTNREQYRKDPRYSKFHDEFESKTEYSRYRPSEMLSSILKSRGIIPSSSTSITGSPIRKENDNSYSSPSRNSKSLISSYYEDSPTLSPARDYDSPRSGYDSPLEEKNDGVSPFVRLSESLKMLQQTQSTSLLAPTSEPHPQPEVETQPSVEPSEDLRPVIERLAQYVAKNGDEFEKGIREKMDPRFDFLNHWNIYHGFYLLTKQKAKDDLEREKEEELERRKNLKVKFGLKPTKQAPVKSKRNIHSNSAAAIFNQNDDDDHVDDVTADVNSGLNSKRDNENDTKNKLEQDDEPENNYPTPQSRYTPKQHAALKRKAQTESLIRKDSTQNDSTNLPRAYSSSSTGRTSKSKQDYPTDIKRKYRDSSASKNPLGKTELLTKKKDAFHQAINDAFKSNS